MGHSAVIALLYRMPKGGFASSALSGSLFARQLLQLDENVNQSSFDTFCSNDISGNGSVAVSYAGSVTFVSVSWRPTLQGNV
jgi:hypothetical protein